MKTTKILAFAALVLTLGAAACAPQRVLTRASGFQTSDKDHFYIIENVAGQSSKILKCTINADNSAKCVAQVK